MALKDVEGFLNRCANDEAFAALFSSKPDDALDMAGVTDMRERALLKRRDSHEIKDYMKDSYGASLSVEIS
jgi:hypothetical protein